ncbi:MAG: GerMN domain-containing protein [Lachnospiraceae bacterium]|nr:GerMN domain-containing protein [Lachnospiraceae bacterium]
MKMIKKILVCLMVIALVLPVSGCANIRSIIERMRSRDTDDDTARGYYIYYIDESMTHLVPTAYQFTATSEEGILAECIEVLQTQPEKQSLTAPLTSELGLKNYEYDTESKILSMYFDSNYNSFDPGQEILVRAAIVKTTTQFKGIIDYVRFEIDGSWLMDSDGSIMLMKSSDFVESVRNDEGELLTANITLYYASPTGQGLKALRIKQKYNPSSALENVVLDALIRGPVIEEYRAVLSKNTQIRELETVDGVCSIDFNKAFLESVNGQDIILNVYSVVNSLTSLPDIDYVRITVNGEELEDLEDGTRLSGNLEFNAGLVGK